jgi:putative transposase
VAQRFQRCDRLARREAALAAEVLMAAPPRGNTGYSVYFITASTAQRSLLFRKEPMARLFLDALFHYRDHKNYLLHEFVVMPDHFHLLISPTLSLERSLQLIKGGFSYRAKKELGFAGEIWEKSFYDRRVRGADDYYNFCIFGKAALSKKVRRRKIPHSGLAHASGEAAFIRSAHYKTSRPCQFMPS